MKFYREDIKGANGVLHHRDMFEHISGEPVIRAGQVLEQKTVGEVTAQEIKFYPADWASYLAELQAEGRALPDMQRILGEEVDFSEAGKVVNVDIPETEVIEEENLEKDRESEDLEEE